MNRRNFVKSLMAGSALLGLGNMKLSWAAGTSDHYFVNIVASGGWDTTSLCDPKGDILYSESRGVINRYSVADIRKVGQLRYAPLLDKDYADNDHIDAFFKRHYGDVRIYNGVNGGTNAHPVGRRTNQSGDSSKAQPDTAALLAALHKDRKPLAYYLGSGSTITGGTVGASRLNDISTLEKLAAPYSYLPDEITERMLADHDLTIEQVSGELNTFADQKAMREYLEGHKNANELDPLLDALPSSVSSGSKGQAEISAAAFASGSSNCSMITVGGFDTHGDNDARQNRNMMSLFETINHLIDELERHGVADRTTILICSDFGRTPYYNTQNGKDHWTVGSMMIWSRVFPGNKVIGATDGQLNALKIDPITLELDPNGIELVPAHLHMALRDRMGLLGTSLDREFPLSGIPVLDLLS